MRVYIVHPSDKARRLSVQRINVYECELKPIAQIESHKANIELFGRVMQKFGRSGVRIVISESERGFIDDGFTEPD